MTVSVEEENIIKSILNVRCREGATIADIERDYEEIIGKPLLGVYNYLNSMDCVYCISEPNGGTKWYAKSDNMNHLTKLILEQRSTFKKPKPQQMLNDSVNGNDCFFKDNLIYKHMRKGQKLHNHTFNSPFSKADMTKSNYTYQKCVSNPTSPKRTHPHLDAQLVGDDFFRLLVARDTAGPMTYRNDGVQQTGLCVSGLSISAAVKLIELTTFFKSKTLILNVGSVDILHGNQISDMCADHDRLIRVCEQRGILPIITTLAPLPNDRDTPEIRKKLSQFNAYLLNKYETHTHHVIDIWSQMVSPLDGTNDSECFESKSTKLSGSHRPLVMWSEYGRSKIRIHIHQNLEKILKRKTSERLFFGA